MWCDDCVDSGINDKHIWFSVCGRPWLSDFTRSQRLVCCLTLVLGYLISNIMFYGIEPPADDWRLSIGPIEITKTEIAIGNFPHHKRPHLLAPVGTGQRGSMLVQGAICLFWKPQNAPFCAYMAVLWVRQIVFYVTFRGGKAVVWGQLLHAPT